MSIEFLLLVLALSATTYIPLGRWSRAGRRRLGIEDGSIVSVDDSWIHTPTLRSERLSLAGRCDYLLRVGDAYVPVEQKPSARRLYRSHLLQVGALCLLVEEIYQMRLPHGVVILADEVRVYVPFTEGLEREVRETMSEMRLFVASGCAPGRRWVAAKCRACGYFSACWDQGKTVI